MTSLLLGLLGTAFLVVDLIWAKKDATKRRLQVAIAICSAVSLVWAWHLGIEEQKRTATSGTLKIGSATGGLDSLTVLMATNSATLVGFGLSDGRPVEPFKAFAFSSLEAFPCSVRLTNKGPLVSATIRSWDGKQAAELSDNEWSVNPEGRWRRNYDDHAVEVMDEYGVIVLQLELVDSHTIRLGGVFWESESEPLVTIIGSTNMTPVRRPATVAALIETAESQCGLRRWFEYPSETRRGRRVKPIAPHGSWHMQLFGLTVLLAIGGTLIGALWTLAIGLGGAPGAVVSELIMRRRNTRVLPTWGVLLTVAGQLYAALCFTAFVVKNVGAVVSGLSGVGVWVMWTVACLVSEVPIWAALKDAHQAEVREVQHVAAALMGIPAGLGFFVFAFFPKAMGPLWNWVPQFLG